MGEATENNHRFQDGIDVDALRAKYKAERDKRIRADGNQQYHYVEGEFARYVDDPHIDGKFVRPPLTDSVEVVIVGAGISGLVVGARMREVGFERIRLIDRASDVGGTWYWNRYPGAQCDIESYIYLPLLEEMGYVPKEKYAYQPEIFEYLRSVAKAYELDKDACLQTSVTGMDWSDETGHWLVSTDRGDRITTQFLIIANGPLSRPKLPGIPGIETFKGPTFHTSRWDYGYTKGDHGGNLSGLADKRVGVIGTGATAVQCIPHLAASAQQLYVFQRTPSSISERNNVPTDPEWARSLRPGWQSQRMANFSIITAGGHQDEDLVADAWTDLFRSVPGAVATPSSQSSASPEELIAFAEVEDLRRMEHLRARVDRLVADRLTAEALKPYYRLFCKRPCFHDEYLPAFNRPNVTLVDTEGKGVECISESAVVVGGASYEVDCLVFATGFESGTLLTHQIGVDANGRNGLSLSEKWKDGMATLHGLQTHGFPNFFTMGITQTGVGANFTHMAVRQADHIAYILRSARAQGAGTVEVSAEAEQGWVATMREKQALNLNFWSECTPGRFNNEGKPGVVDGTQSRQYGDGLEAFGDVLREWRDEGSLAGLVFARTPAESL